MKKKMTLDNRFHHAVSRFLRRHGWGVVLTGPFHVEHNPGDNEFKFRFVISFLGRKPTDHDDPVRVNRKKGADRG